MIDIELRQQLIATAVALNTSGINQGTSGNVSVRAEGGFLITPSGMSYQDLCPDDIVLMDMDGNFKSARVPSSEWRFHLDIYVQRDDINAIVHTHSLRATALSCLNREIPAFHYMVAVAGGHNIRCSPYATYGTQALSDHAIHALRRRYACLLGHHGVIATGDKLFAALALAGDVECLAHQYLDILKIAEPDILSREEMDKVVEKFKTYGEKAQQ